LLTQILAALSNLERDIRAEQNELAAKAEGLQ
jgi:hypothetical protein